MNARLSSVVVALCLAVPASGMRPQMPEQRRGEHYKSLTKGDGSFKGFEPVETILEGMRQRAAKERMDRDLARLRELRDQIAARVAAGGPIDYTTISEQTGEIRKRTKRLKKQLPLVKVPPADGQGGEIEIDVECLPDTLTALCARIDSFVESSLFVSEDEINVPEARRAFEDVTAILDLSDGIQRTAERLKKSPKP